MQDLAARFITLEKSTTNKGEPAIKGNFDVLMMNEWMEQWKNRGWKTAKGKEVKNRWLWELLDGSSKGLPVIFKHVRGHSGVPGNEKADSLAMSAAETLNV